jgi:signal peptidase I
LSVFRRLIFGENPRRTAVRVIVLAATSFVVFTWLLIPIRTDGISMLPTYSPDKLNLVNRLSYVGSARPHRGDVVAIQIAGPHVLYIKRIVGLPHERVAVAQGRVMINGSPLAEAYVRHRRPWDVQEVTLEAGEYFVMGDNRGMAAGDHDFGRVRLDRILGKVVF